MNKIDFADEFKKRVMKEFSGTTDEQSVKRFLEEGNLPGLGAKLRCETAFLMSAERVIKLFQDKNEKEILTWAKRADRCTILLAELRRKFGYETVEGQARLLELTEATIEVTHRNLQEIYGNGETAIKFSTIDGEIKYKRLLTEPLVSINSKPIPRPPDEEKENCTTTIE